MAAQFSGIRKLLVLFLATTSLTWAMPYGQASDSTSSSQSDSSSTKQTTPTQNQLDPFDCSRKLAPIDVPACVRQHISAYANKNLHTLDYNHAREQMFQYVDEFEDNNTHERMVKSVYTEDTFPVGDHGIPQNGVNAEHSFCQSWLKPWPRFAEARSDLFHIFPLQGKENSRRNNLPFSDCTPQGTNPAGRGIRCETGYEPPDNHKGKLARAMFYISVTYNIPMDDTMEAILREWAHNYPITREESDRANRVTDVQGNKNPFIDHPEWIDLISNF